MEHRIGDRRPALVPRRIRSSVDRRPRRPWRRLGGTIERLTNTELSPLEIARLLAGGGDSRLTLVDDRASNRYGCRYVPEDGLLPLGSCTGSSIRHEAFEVVVDAVRSMPTAQRDLERWGEGIASSIRERLAGHLFRDSPPGCSILLTPSGTDAEFVPLVLAGAGSGRTVRNIVVAPVEVGGGTTDAATGDHFDADAPHVHGIADGGPFPAGSVDLRTVAIRHADGSVRDPEEIDADIERLVEEGMRRFDVTIAHVVAHSKTGVHAPSLAVIDELRRRHGDRLLVVVDAAQGRISRRGLADALDRGRVVLFTGSKFYGGPPFAGAVLLPPHLIERLDPPDDVATGLRSYFRANEAPESASRWRSKLDPSPNVGLLLRWTAALEEFDRYYDHAPELRLALLRAFTSTATTEFARSPSIAPEAPHDTPRPVEGPRLLESNQTVISFALHTPSGSRLTADELRTVRSRLRSGPVDDPDGVIHAIELGQPVPITPDGASVLRIALGAPLIDRWAGASDPTAAVRRELAVAASALESAVERLVADGEVGP